MSSKNVHEQIYSRKKDLYERKIFTFYAGQVWMWISFLKALLIAGLVVVLLSSFFAGGRAGSLFYLLGWILIIYCYFRIFSKNVSKRYAENQKYLAKTYKIRTYIQQQKNSLAQRKAYHIYKCPGCKQKIRIPKGKGKD